MWNAVKLDGNWYHVDVTSDANAMSEMGLSIHQYLNRTDEYMLYEYLWHDTDIRINAPIICKATAYNYYTMNGQQPITSDEELVSIAPELAAEARRNGNPMFELEFDLKYATSDEIVGKLRRLSGEHYDDVVFSWGDRVIIGVFD